jgi:DNA-directed RNA polymerase specialized sigma24 family protein
MRASSPTPLDPAASSFLQENLALILWVAEQQAWWLSRKLGLQLQEADRKDLVQDLLTAVCKRLPKYNKQKYGVKRITYVNRIIYWRALEFLRNRARCARRRRCVSLDDPGHSEEVEAAASRLALEHSRQVSEHRDLKLDLTGLFPKLPPEVRVYYKRLSEATHSPARKPGISPAKLRKLLKAVSEVLSRKDMDKYLNRRRRGSISDPGADTGPSPGIAPMV